MWRNSAWSAAGLIYSYARDGALFGSAWLRAVSPHKVGTIEPLYAEDAAAIEKARATFSRKWKLQCPPVLGSAAMRTGRSFAMLAILAVPLCLLASEPRQPDLAAEGPDPVARLVAEILGPSPLYENLRRLTDEIGGRIPGTEGNRRGVAWAVEALRAAGVDQVHTEAFTLPVGWAEGETRLEIVTEPAFEARAVSIAWAPPTPPEGIEARVVDLGDGTDANFARAQGKLAGALLLVNRGVLRSWADLMAEYANAPPVLERAVRAGAAGVLWISTHEQGLLYRHMNTGGTLDVLPQALLAREDGLRIARFLAAGRPLSARLRLPNRVGSSVEAENVVAEIRGSQRPEEVVALGAHLDSWDLGSGALDNGCSAALVVEVARAVRAAGLRPRRTLRFLLWNGEEQGLLGSWAYVRAHRAELDRLAAYVNFDGGTGRVTGYSLGGRQDIEAAVREVLKPLEAWGMNDHTLNADGGTDHVDFLLEGVPTLSANQEEANYLANYHASSDTLDKVSMRDLKLHAAYAAVTVVGLANLTQRPGPRQTRPEVEALVRQTGFDKYLKESGKWEAFQKGERGREK